MSKLTIVENALRTNPNVVVLNSSDINNPIKNQKQLEEIIECEHLSHVVKCYVAPKGGLYTRDDLQGFMMGLVPDLKPTSTFNFEEVGSILRFGRLYYEEVLLEIESNQQITARLKDESLKDVESIKNAGFVEGVKTIDKVVSRKYKTGIHIFVYPSRDVARDISDCGYAIKIQDLEKYKGQEGLVPHPAFIKGLLGIKVYPSLEAKDLTPQELRDSKIQDNSLYTILVELTSPAGRAYTLVHVAKKPHGPSIILYSDDTKDKSDFEEIKLIVAREVGQVKSIGDVSKSTDRISATIYLRKKLTQERVADFVEGYNNHFKDVKIPKAHYHNVPKPVIGLPSEKLAIN